MEKQDRRQERTACLLRFLPTNRSTPPSPVARPLVQRFQEVQRHLVVLTPDVRSSDPQLPTVSSSYPLLSFHLSCLWPGGHRYSRVSGWAASSRLGGRFLASPLPQPLAPPPPKQDGVGKLSHLSSSCLCVQGGPGAAFPTLVRSWTRAPSPRIECSLAEANPPARLRHFLAGLGVQELLAPSFKNGRRVFPSPLCFLSTKGRVRVRAGLCSTAWRPRRSQCQTRCGVLSRGSRAQTSHRFLVPRWVLALLPPFLGPY